MPRRMAAATLTAAALTAVILTGAGCTKGSGGSTPTTLPSSPSSSPMPSVDPSAQAICDDLQRNILDTDAKAFGAELGKMIVARASGDTANQAKSQQAAIAKLREIETKLRADATKATDPRLKSALNDAADNLEKLAADTDSFNKINSLDTVSQTTKRFVESFNEIGKFCALPSTRS
jgi:hypothetical protein